MSSQQVIKSYLGWFQSNFAEIINEKKSVHPLSLVDIKKCRKSGGYKLVVQVSGKNVFCFFEPSEIYLNSSFLTCFSALDASKITELSLLQITKKQYQKNESRSFKYIGSKSVGSSSETTLVFNDSSTQNEVEKTVGELVQDQQFRNRIVAEDLFNVGYMCGIKFISNIKNKIMKLRGSKCKS